jgi:hypothetical protein
VRGILRLGSGLHAPGVTDLPETQRIAAEVEIFNNRGFLDPIFRGTYPDGNGSASVISADHQAN